MEIVGCGSEWVSQGLADKLIELSSKYPLFLQYACLGFNGELSIPAKIIVKNLNLKQGFVANMGVGD